MVDTDRCVPVGFDVEVDDDYDAVTVGWGAGGAGGELLLFIAAMSPFMISVKAVKLSVVEPEPGAGDYKFMTRQPITVSETPAHTYRIPTSPAPALTLNYRSLRSNWRSIRQSCKQSQKGRRHVVWK